MSVGVTQRKTMYWDEEDVTNLLLDIPAEKERVKALEESVKDLSAAVQELEVSAAQKGRVFVGQPGGVLFKTDPTTALKEARAKELSEKKALREARLKLDGLIRKQLARQPK